MNNIYPEEKNNDGSDLSSMLSGVSGEYFVAAELSKKGYIASLTLRNTRGIDILCSNTDASKTIGIQVKTNRREERSWVLNKKGENYQAENLFYVFVNLNNNKRPPDFFIVPSTVVAKYIKEKHQDWLRTPGKNGRKHKDNTLRKFFDPNENYLNKWELLKL